MASSTVAQASLSVVTIMPALPGLVVSSGEIVLEHLGLIGGDTMGYDRTAVDRVTIPLGGPQQTFAFPTASLGIYSRVRTEIDRIELNGTWQGTSLHISTVGDERIVDIRGPDQELSSTQSISFTLRIDSSDWLTPTLLDDATTAEGGLEIDEDDSPLAVDAIMSAAVGSFTLSAP
jgi:hypothetical protein